MNFLIQVGRRNQEPTKAEGAEEMEKILIGVLTGGGTRENAARSTASSVTRTLENGGRYEPDHLVADLVGGPGPVRVWREEEPV